MLLEVTKHDIWVMSLVFSLTTVQYFICILLFPSSLFWVVAPVYSWRGIVVPILKTIQNKQKLKVFAVKTVKVFQDSKCSIWWCLWFLDFLTVLTPKIMLVWVFFKVQSQLYCKKPYVQIINRILKIAVLSITLKQHMKIWDFFPFHRTSSMCYADD